MTKKEREKFGHIVRRLRNEKGYTQEAFADQINAERSYYGRIERGQVNFGFDKIVNIIQGLEMTWAAVFKHMDKK